MRASPDPDDIDLDAEFVADADTVRLLRQTGVDDAQGYHVGPPRLRLAPLPLP